MRHGSDFSIREFEGEGLPCANLGCEPQRPPRCVMHQRIAARQHASIAHAVEELAHSFEVTAVCRDELLHAPPLACLEARELRQGKAILVAMATQGMAVLVGATMCSVVGAVVSTLKRKSSLLLTPIW